MPLPPAADCNRLGHGRDAMQRVVAAGPPEETETPGEGQRPGIIVAYSEPRRATETADGKQL